jgi:hypothetical protein
VDEFTAVSRARETYALFAEALQKGRDILLRAGIAEDPPPIPDFDAVYPRLSASLKRQLFAELETLSHPTIPDAMRVWNPLLKAAFGQTRK